MRRSIRGGGGGISIDRGIRGAEYGHGGGGKLSIDRGDKRNETWGGGGGGKVSINIIPGCTTVTGITRGAQAPMPPSLIGVKAI